MKVYHVMLEREDDWFSASAMEDPAVFTQGKSLDEIIANIREVADLMYGEKDVQVELIVPPGVLAGVPRIVNSRSKRTSKTPSRIARNMRQAGAA